MHSQKSYDKIKNLAENELNEALLSIKARLKEWEGAHENGCENWLDEQRYSDLFSCIERFIKGRKKYEAELKITGWWCGLCQTIDLRRDEVAGLLPILLTAYIYNYSKNRFVLDFWEKNSDAQFPFEILCGATFGTELECSNEDIKQIAGIGSLLTEQRLTRRDKRNEEKYIESFRFPVRRIVFSVQNEEFVVPESEENKFESMLIVTPSNITIFPNEHHIYKKRDILNIFRSLYWIASNRPGIRDRLMPVHCWILLNEFLCDKEEIDGVSRLLSESSVEDVTLRYKKYLEIKPRFLNAERPVDKKRDYNYRLNKAAISLLIQQNTSNTEQRLKRIREILPWEDWKGLLLERKPIAAFIQTNGWNDKTVESALRVFALSELFQLSPSKTLDELFDRRSFFDFCEINPSNCPDKKEIVGFLRALNQDEIGETLKYNIVEIIVHDEVTWEDPE